jgi:hypothetical protein
MGISSADPLVLHDQFLQFTYSVGGSRAHRFFMQLLWICCIWVIWHERNNRIFKAKESTVLQLLERVKVHSLWWMQAYNINIGINLHVWWSSPLGLYGHWLAVVWFFVDFWGSDYHALC